MRTAKKVIKNSKSCEDCIEKTLEILHKDHEFFKEGIAKSGVIVHDIKENTSKSTEYLKEIKETNKSHLELIAGKKQVPLNIFVMIVALLSGLLIAKEVQYSGVEINIPYLGIHISKGK